MFSVPPTVMLPLPLTQTVPHTVPVPHIVWVSHALPVASRIPLTVMVHLINRTAHVVPPMLRPTGVVPPIVSPTDPLTFMGQNSATVQHAPQVLLARPLPIWFAQTHLLWSLALLFTQIALPLHWHVLLKRLRDHPPRRHALPFVLYRPKPVKLGAPLPLTFRRPLPFSLCRLPPLMLGRPLPLPLSRSPPLPLGKPLPLPLAEPL